MKFLLIVFAIAATTSAYTDEDWVAGVTVRSSRATVPETAVDVTAECQKFNGASVCSSTPGCANATSYLCYNGLALKIADCGGTTPYCSDGTCVASSSGCTASSYICPGPGYFPAYDNCLIYYYCYVNGDTLTAVQKTCNSGYAFNPTGPQDRLCLRGSACVKGTCTSGRAYEWKPMNYQGFTKDQIALYCVAAKPIRVDSCPAGLSFDTTYTNGKRCVIKCTKDYQKAAASNSTTGYYVCRGGSAYYEECEIDQVFDGKTLTCITAPSTTAATTAAGGSSDSTTTAAGGSSDSTTTAAGGSSDSTTTLAAGGSDSTTTTLEAGTDSTSTMAP